MVKLVPQQDQKHFDKLAPHVMQAWAWGEFREKTGVQVLRLGRYEKDKLVETAQITVHRIPHTSFKIGYWPKGNIPSNEMLEAVLRYTKDLNVVLVKMEPNVLATENQKEIAKLQNTFPIKSGRPMFTKFTFWLDLDKTEDQLLAQMKPKTRYNTRLAERKGVKIVEDNSAQAFEEYWRLTQETMTRQGFYAHTKRYHQLMFQTTRQAGISHLFRAVLDNKTLTTWVIFKLNKVLYYPYGASTRDDKNVFPNNLMMWEMIKFGKQQKCTKFDMWGSLGPVYENRDPWAGFHRFKEGYGGKLVEFVGTYDLVVNPLLYPVYTFGNDRLRWWFLRLKTKLNR